MIEGLGRNGGWKLETSLLVPGSLVISAGLGNSISFEADLLKRKCRVIGVDPTSLAFEATKSLRSGFSLVRAALGPEDGKISFSAARSNGSGVYDKAGGKTTVPMVSLARLIEENYPVDAVKMNIEGGEYRTLYEIPHLDVPQVSVYFHHRKADVPYSLADTKRIVKRMRGMGYRTVYSTDPFSKNADFVVLFVRKDVLASHALGQREAL